MSKPLPYYRSSILGLLVAPALGGFLFGYDTGGTSYVILQLASLDRSSHPLSLEDDPLKTGWFVAAPSAGALLGLAALLYLDGSNTNRTNDNVSRKDTTSAELLPFILQPIGRKTELFYASILYTFGGFLQYQASVLVFQKYSFAIISTGRLIYGAGIGFAMHGGPTFLAETTPPSIRGMVVSGKEIALVLGMLCGYVVGRHFCDVTEDTGTTLNEHNGSWAYVYGVASLVAMAMAAGSQIVPESPRYLASRLKAFAPHRDTNDNTTGNEELVPDDTTTIAASNDDIIDESNSSSADAVAATCRRASMRSSLSSSECVDDEDSAPSISLPSGLDEQQAEILESLQFVWKLQAAQEEHRKLLEGMANTAQDEASTTKSPSVCSFISDSSFRPALAAGMGLVVLQQVTGQPTVLSYATSILAGVPGMSSNASVMLAVYKVLGTLVSVGLVERYGRKSMLLAGCLMMLVALGIMVVAFRKYSAVPDITASENETAPASSSMDINSIAALVGMFPYIAGYQIGFGPITWLMLSEVFPQSIRGKAVALAVQLNFGGNALMQLIVPIIDARLGCSKTFLIFCGLTAYSVWFVQRYVPETKGLSLEEIEAVLAKVAPNKGRLSPTETDIGLKSKNNSNEDEDNEEEEMVLLSNIELSQPQGVLQEGRCIEI